MTTMNVATLISDCITILNADSPYTTNIGAGKTLPVWAVPDEGVNVKDNPTLYSVGRLQAHCIVKPGLVFSGMGITSADSDALVQNIEFWFYSGAKYKTIIDAVVLLHTAFRTNHVLANGGHLMYYRDFYPDNVGDLESQKIIRTIFEVHGLREVV